MAVTSKEFPSGISLDVGTGQRTKRRNQRPRSTPKWWSKPVRRAQALAKSLFGTALRTKPRGLCLNLPEYTVRFAGPAEFEFALASRVEFPVRKLAPLMQRSADDLQVMASNIRQVEKRFAEALAESMNQPGLISGLLGNIELKLFSKDHQWRNIVEALNDLSPAYDVYKQIALVKYLQYLGCRQDVLRNLYLAKLKTLGSGARAVDTAADAIKLPEPATLSALERSPPLATRPTAGTQVVSMRDTAIFHIERFQIDGDIEGFAVLPRGETVDVTFQPGACIEILLSSYRLKLYPGQRYRLTDEDGNIHILASGKNLVGRHDSADVTIGADNRAISRKHLVIEPVSPSCVKLTDLSSHGTSIPVEYVRQAT